MEMMNYRFEDLININQDRKATEQLKTLGNYWIGEDMSLEKKIIVPPLSLMTDVNIIVNKNDFPDVDINRDSLAFLNWSVRSCLAQSGTEIIYNGLSVTDNMLEDINAGKNVPIPIYIINNVARPLELEGKVLRFFWANDANRLRGEDLREVITNKDLIIEGEEGRDWSMEGVGSGKEGEPVCVRLRLEEKYYIPRSPEILKVNSKKELPDILEKIPAGDNIDFKIGETVKVKLGNNIMAVINTGGYDDGSSHIHSPLIDPGFEGPIRTETVYGLKYIELMIYKK